MKKAIFFSILAGTVLLQAVAWAQNAVIPDAEKAAIVRTALDYGEGYYSGAAERMERALHPDFNKVWTRILPQTNAVMIGYSTFSGLVEATRAKLGFLEPAARKITAEALYLNEDVACAKMTSSQFNDYLQMIKVDGQWKIINVLWTPGPDSQIRQPLTDFNPEREKEAIVKTALDFVEGSMSGDLARVTAVLHPEVNRVVFQKLPMTGKMLVNRSRYSSLVEPLRAKLSLVVPENQRQVEVRVIDVMDGMAMVEAKTLFGFYYMQMFWFEKQWKLINMLVKINPNAPRPPQK